MNLHKTLDKFFLIGLTVFLLLNTSSLGFYHKRLQKNLLQEDPIPSIFGVMGANEWYITAVTISFDYDPNIVEEIQYYLNNKWNIYTGPFNVNKDGIYKISWFWIDKKGDTHYTLTPISFKIDQTPPTIQLTKKSGGKNKVLFTANAIDEVSQVERVEFYLDDVLQETVNESPFQYTWTGEVNQWVYAIGYNFAGLSQKSKNLSTPKLHFNNHNLMNILYILMQKIFLHFY